MDPPVNQPAAPARQRPELTAAWLAQRYLVDRLTTEQISAQSGWSSQYVRDRLRDHGIPLRRPGTHAGLRTVDRDTLDSWLRDGVSIRGIAARTGYSVAGVRGLLLRHGLEPPDPAAIRAAAVRDDPTVAEVVRLYRDEGRGLAEVADLYKRSADWVKARLLAAGVPVRPAGRRAVLDPDQVRGLLDDGLRVADIAERCGCSDTAVLTLMRERGWTGPPRRPRGPTRNTPVLPPAVLRRLYVTDGLSVAEVAAALHVSPHRVSEALAAAGINRRRPGWVDGAPPPPIDAERLTALYVREGRSVRQVADLLQVNAKRVEMALRRHGIPRRPEPAAPPPPLPVDRATLTELYVTQRLDDATIARRYGVPTWRVTTHRRELGVHRPQVGPPRPPRPGPPEPGELNRLYVGEHLTLHQLGRRYHTSGPVVRAWLVDAGIPVQPRKSRAHRKQLDPVLLRHLYQDREWTAEHIAANQDTTIALVLRALHENGIPVRRGGTRPPDPDGIDPRLTALYSDPEITALLHRHRIPQRHRPGSITERFPTPARLTERFLRAAYLDIGLATAHIEQLTGQPAEQILDRLHHHGIPVRNTHSPWYQRQLHP